MKDKKKKNKPKEVKPKTPLSAAKKRIFLGITISLPFILFILLEIGLRIFNYGGNLNLVIEGPPGYEKYLRCNPNVARRYFDTQTIIPTPPTQLFLKEKPANGYRIFVLGESSAAGFPYGNNASFPNILQRALSDAFPEKNIEVISVAMSAINSYTLLDLTGEILEQTPDALLIYTGHNEYYGALGVGSTQSLGSSRWLIRTYLKLQSIKAFIVLRDVIGSIKIFFSRILYGGSEVDPTATLMEQIVADQTIPYGSSMYEDGKEQFKENMEAIISAAKTKGVKVVLSELVSNLRNQEPFISVQDKNGESARSFFTLGRKLESEEKFDEARVNYSKAKDLDALRFRASEDFNKIITELAKQYSLPLVPAISYFEKESPHGLIGNNLMWEHLHPNKEGYFLLAKAFYETMQKNNLISSQWNTNDVLTIERNNGITELDSVYAAMAVHHLKGSWPFQPKGLPNRFAQNFQPSNQLEEIALRILSTKNYNLITGHYELGEYYERKAELDKAYAEYMAQVVSIPHEMEFYRSAATVLIKQKRYDEASALLQKSLRYKETQFANKWVGQIAYMRSDFKKAVAFMRKADMNDPQVLFNLSRTYYTDNQWEMGEEYFQRLKNISPRSEYVAYLMKMRLTIQVQKQLRKPSDQ